MPSKNINLLYQTLPKKNNVSFLEKTEENIEELKDGLVNTEYFDDNRKTTSKCDQILTFAFSNLSRACGENGNLQQTFNNNYSADLIKEHMQTNEDGYYFRMHKDVLSFAIKLIEKEANKDISQVTNKHLQEISQKIMTDYFDDSLL